MFNPWLGEYFKTSKQTDSEIKNLPRRRGSAQTNSRNNLTINAGEVHRGGDGAEFGKSTLASVPRWARAMVMTSPAAGILSRDLLEMDPEEARDGVPRVPVSRRNSE